MQILLILQDNGLVFVYLVMTYIISFTILPLQKSSEMKAENQSMFMEWWQN